MGGDFIIPTLNVLKLVAYDGLSVASVRIPVTLNLEPVVTIGYASRGVINPALFYSYVTRFI